MATILAPQFGREVLRCNHCDLVQFTIPKKLCRRCRQPYDWEPSFKAEQPDNIPTVESYPRTDSVRDRIAFNVLNLRQLRGLTQKEIGLRMGVPRTYVSKIEGRKVTPTLSSLECLARVLDTTVVGLVTAPNDPVSNFCPNSVAIRFFFKWHVSLPGLPRHSGRESLIVRVACSTSANRNI